MVIFCFIVAKTYIFVGTGLQSQIFYVHLQVKKLIEAMRNVLLITFALVALVCHGQHCIEVKKGDAQSLLEAIAEANRLNVAADAKPLFILIPDGDYNLGDRVLTRITGNHIAFIGQSTEGTVIRNHPDEKNEGISKTGIFQNRGTDNYFQDLTLKNELDYYACKSAGRAVTLHDKGTRTICNRVRMLSYQDTYYSDHEECQHYFSQSEIHGTVDFICGAGDVWFERCRIVTEKRSADGSGRNVIAAPRTSNTRWGYIFNRCTVENIVSPFEYARGWHTTPHCAWLYTTLLSPDKLCPSRFDYHGMRTVESDFKEYGTMDGSGRNITPPSNIITFKLTTKKQEGDKEIITELSHTDETILTEAQAARYTIENVFGSWHPDQKMKKLERQARKLLKRLQ